MNLIPRVVVLDDDANVRQLFQSVLEKKNLNVRVASSVSGLIKRVQSDHFDASIIDIRLSPSGSEGLDAIVQLQEIRPDMYIEVQTAYRQYVEEAYKRGADQVFIKPDGYNPDASERIRAGILKKKLSFLASKTGLDINIISPSLPKPENEYETNRAALNVSLLTELAPVIKGFVAKNFDEYNLEESAAGKLGQDIVELLVNRTMGNLTVESSEWNEKVDNNDQNYRAYLEQRATLLIKYRDHFVAFVNGELVMADKDRQHLFDEIDRRYPLQEVFIKQILQEQKILHFNIPKRIKR